MGAYRRTVLIDGYNLIRRVDDWNEVFLKDMAAARDMLLKFCSVWRGSRRDIGEVTVVFDGNSSFVGGAQSVLSDVRAVFTETGEEADDRIISFIENHPHPERLLVVSDDNKVRQKAHSHKAQRMSVQEFRKIRRPFQKKAGKHSGHGSGKDLTPVQEKEINDMLKRAYGLE